MSEPEFEREFVVVGIDEKGGWYTNPCFGDCDLYEIVNDTGDVRPGLYVKHPGPKYWMWRWERI